MQSNSAISSRPPLMTETEVATYLAVDVGTLRAWRLRGQGPRYSKVGRLVRYDTGELQAWLDSRMRSHTSEAEG